MVPQSTAIIGGASFWYTTFAVLLALYGEELSQKRSAVSPTLTV
jgi:hypothetical protein